MNRPLKLRRSAIVITLLLFFGISIHISAVPIHFQNTEATSTKQEALAFLKTIKELENLSNLNKTIINIRRSIKYNYKNI